MNTITQSLYRELSQAHTDSVRIEDFTTNSCVYKKVLRFLGEEPDKDLEGSKALSSEMSKRIKAKVLEYSQECFGDRFTPGYTAQLHDLVDVEFAGAIDNQLFEVIVVSGGAYDGILSRGLPSWVKATVAVKAHLTKKKSAHLILFSRNNQKWSGWTLSGNFSVCAKEILGDVKKFKAMLGGAQADGDKNSCNRCEFKSRCTAIKDKAVAPLTVKEIRSTPNSDLCSDLDSHLWGMNRKKNSRATHCIHPSEFSISSCDRRIAYGLLGSPRRSEISPSLRRIFDVGHILHDIVQESISKAFGDSCEIEAPVRHESLKIRGSCDGVLHGTDGLEIKSISSKGFDKLSNPKRDHQKQATLYGVPRNLERMIYLYGNKDTGEIAEFNKPVDKGLWHTLAARAESIIRTADKGEMPDRTTKAYECSKCPFVDTCAPTQPRPIRKIGGLR